MTEQPTALGTVQPRARGEVRASFSGADGMTRLAGLRQAGSSRALFPRSQAKSAQMVLTNTSGGVTGGDRFRTDITVEQGAVVTVTTQAAERAYRAQPGQVGRIDTTLNIGAESRLHWLPQETILFDGCNFARRLTLDLAPDASALVVEPVIFGRAAMGETIRQGRFTDRIELRIGGQPAFLDRTRLIGDIAATLNRPAVGDGAQAMAFVLFADPAAEAARDRLRPMLPETAGTSLIRPDLMVARFLAEDAFVLRQSLLPVIETLHGDTIPRPWMI